MQEAAQASPVPSERLPAAWRIERWKAREFEGCFERTLRYGAIDVGLSVVDVADVDCSMFLRDYYSLRDEVACSFDLVEYKSFLLT